jgi:cytochrome c553
MSLMSKFWMCLLLFCVAEVNAATPPAAGNCVSCHGARGEGNAALGAPPLAGQHAAYLAHQLNAFKSGQRAYDPEDKSGGIMRNVASTLSAAEITELSEYFSNLPVAAHITPAHLDAGVARGKELFRTSCASCHGVHGQGYPQMKAPSLKMLGGWYVERQLDSYSKGWRGDSEQADQPAVWMRSIATNVSNPADIAALVHYLDSLASSP